MLTQFSTPRVQVIVLSFLICFGISCQKAVLDTEPIVSAAKAGGGNALQQVNLTVEVVDFDGAKIRSDGKLAYVHGSGKVAAYLDGNGNFIFDTYSGMNRNSPMPAERSLTFIFDRPLSGTATQTYNSSNGSYRIVTLLKSGGTPIQNMSIPSNQDISMGGGFRRPTSNTADWNFSMRYNAENTSTSPTSYAKVSRTGTDTWEITGQVANPVTALRINGVTTASYYYLPFKLILTRKP